MALFDEARSQIVNALQAWDFSPAFPTAYTGAKSVQLVSGWPYEVIDNMQGETQAQMTQPIISVVLADSVDTYRSLGGHFGGGVNPPTLPVQRFGTRVGVGFLIESWADQALGGNDTAEALAGQVQGCCFYNRTRLAAVRNLRMQSAKPSYDDQYQVWVYTVHVEGTCVVTYDV